jgi:hypothetical protein
MPHDTGALHDSGHERDGSVVDGTADGAGDAGNAGQALGPASVGYLLGTHPLVIDDVNVYVATNGPLGAGIVAFPKAGGASTTLAPGSYVGDLAIDDTYVYTVQWAAGLAGAYRVPKNGGPMVLVAAYSGSQPLMVPSHPTVDATNLYFFCAEGVGVYAAPLAGGGQVAQIAYVYGTDIVLSGGDLYVAEIEDLVASLSTTGELLGNLTVSAPMAITADADDIYWADGSGSVWMATPAEILGSSSTSPVELAASITDNPGQMVTDGESVYVINMGSYSHGSVVKVPISGAPATTLFAASGGLFVGLAVDSDAVYFTYAGTLYRHAK